MTQGLTTGDCAERLNVLVRMQAFSADFILGQIDDGYLVARVNIRTSVRRRYVRVHPDDLRAYVAKYHHLLLPIYDAEFGPSRAGSAAAS